MLKKQQILICFINALASMNVSLIAPLFPPICKNRNISNEICSYIIAILSFAQIIIFIYSPLILSKFKRDNLFLFSLITQTFITIYYGIMYYIPNNYIFIISGLLVRTLEGFCGSMIGISCFALTSLINEGPDLETATGYMELSWMLGLSLGPTIISILYEIGGYSLPFFFCGIIYSSTIIIYYYLPKSEEEEKDNNLTKKSSEKKINHIEKFEENKMLLSLFKHPQVILLTGAIMIETNNLGFYLPTLVNYLKDTWNIKISKASIFFIASILGYLICLQFINLLTEFFGHFPLISLGHIFGGIACLIIAPIFFLPHSYWTVAIGIFIQGVCSCFINIPVYVQLNEFMKYLFPKDVEKQNNMSAALFNFSFCCADFIAPILGAFITAHFNFEKSAYLSGCMSFCFITFFIWFYYDDIKVFFNKEKSLKLMLNEEDNLLLIDNK